MNGKRHHFSSLALAFFLLAFISLASIHAADPDPSASSTVGMTVNNPRTGSSTTVTELIKDPTGTTTAGNTAFVKTADGYVFLVKNVNEFFYNNDNPPLAYKVLSANTTAHTVEVQAQTTPATTDVATLNTRSTSQEYTDLFGTVVPIVQPPSTTDSGNPLGVRVVQVGAFGSNGRTGALFVPPTSGGNGANGPGVIETNSTIISTVGKIGIEVGSIGGNGGKGGDSVFSFWSGQDGGNGGAGGNVDLTNSTGIQVAATGDGMHGIYAYSRSGAAGNGGGAYLAPAGGTGGHSSNAGNVTVINNGNVSSAGEGAMGIFALSVSNNGGGGGDAWGFVGSSGSASYGGNGGNVSVTNGVGASVSTTGNYSHGILAQSIGGTGGSAGVSGNLLVALSGSADNGGSGGTVTVSNAGTILTTGDNSRGIFAQSAGGAGGTGGLAGGLISLGGAGSNGGSGSTVTVSNLATGTIQTQGTYSDGIFAQSSGGSGGSGSDAYGLVSVGGQGSVAGNGGVVTVSNLGSISTLDDFSRGIVAQSIGGGGGDGGSTGGLVSVGGNAGTSTSGGGTGDNVTVTNGGSIITAGADSTGIHAQSVGGGGGSGGSAGSIGIFAGVAVGGKGASGGDGGAVSITLQGQGNGSASLIETKKDRSIGLFAESVGGGGGMGGGALSLSVGFGASASVAIGGSGAGGGDGGLVTLSKGTGLSQIRTLGADSTGVLLQSVGGGGGHGGYAISVAASGGPASGSLGLSIGGSGDGGGVGGNVTVGSFNSGGTMTSTGFNGSISTAGDRSVGFLAQSVGGGGGSGGLAVAAAAGVSPTVGAGVSIGLGGSGGGGGAGGKVQVGFAGSISTQGNSSTALLAQSIGGGGGNGGASIAASLAVGTGSGGVSIGLGGEGGTASNGGEVTLVTRASSDFTVDPNLIKTTGANSTGILVQSVGGGGGQGGYAISASAAGGGIGAGTVTVGLGGSGGAGGNGGNVSADLESNVETSSVVIARAQDPVTGADIPEHYAENSAGVVVQSIGGGGGSGGYSVAAGGAAAGSGSGAVSVGLGGSGAAGGTGGTVNVKSTGTITTKGDRSAGLVAQSVGGGGGYGGYNISVAGAASSVGSGAIGIGLGGSGGNGNVAGDVTVNTSLGKVSTGGADSIGILAQSIGGGGGHGGYNVTVAAAGAGGGSGALTVGLGGSGGTGANAGNVSLTVANAVSTTGKNSAAIVAQAIGGGGGSGGYNVSASGAGAGSGTAAISVGLGGSGAGGGNGGTVLARITGNVDTLLENSAGIVAQSIGGGGGAGGYNVSVSGAGSGNIGGAIAVGLGGSGGVGGNGMSVDVSSTGTILTKGASSTGLLAQSIGGGGGAGGFNVAAALSGAGSTSGAINVGLGGDGGVGGFASSVIASSSGTITTEGDKAAGFVAQSIGGGGGVGGFNISVSGSGAGTTSGAISVGLGGSGAGGGAGGSVTATTSAAVLTNGEDAAGIVAQSIGGGGGMGGFDVSVAASGSQNSGSVSVGLGGSGAGGGSASTVNLTVTNNVTTKGKKSAGILAQSIGGGGGSGGFDVTAALSGATSNSVGIGVSLGGSGGTGGNADKVTTIVTGDVTTTAELSAGVVSQSLGGGGGNGGMAISGALSFASTGTGAISVGLGGSGGAGGAAGMVDSTVAGTIMTTGADSVGVIAQSVGGGGGMGGMSIVGTIGISKSGTGALAIGIGGTGGGGGNANTVTSTFTGYIQTLGKNSNGLLAQSAGGGGGSGGMNITGSITAAQEGSGSLAVGIGGFGGSGGEGKSVTSTYTGSVGTLGDFSAGILAQSLGGGGGVGGLNVTGTFNLTKKSGGTLGFGLGGFGGDGGNSGDVTSTVRTTVTNSLIETFGDNSSGIVAQSLAGGGGMGGMNVTGAVNLTGENGAAIGIGIGGFGGGAGNAGKVVLDVEGNVQTEGVQSHGLVAQSVGGGGGQGGINISGTLAITQSKGTSSTAVGATIGVGGFGGDGGTAGAVEVTYSGTLNVDNLIAVPDPLDPLNTLYVRPLTGSNGIVAQSLGGGGGVGGLNVSGGISYGSGDGDSRGLTIGVGGFGGTGGDASTVDVSVTSTGGITAYGRGNASILAQSIGGGGGTGATNVSGSITSNAPLIVGVGGTGGNAGVGKNVTVNATSDLTIRSYNSPVSTAGILAQSIGGSGGNGGLDVTGGIVIDKTSSLPSVNFGIGGFGGAGASSGDVSVTHVGNIVASGSWTHGILAQSLAGGGGNGGMNVSGQFDYASSDASGGRTDLTILAGVGGNAGAGAVAGNVFVSQDGDIVTSGDEARGIFAQSIGGGGGTGGMNITAVVAKKSSPIQVGVGGSGAAGAHAGTVTVTRGSSTAAAGFISTNGKGAHGIEATSLGGGGGDAGMNFNLGYTKAGGGANPAGFAANFVIGGSGGAAANGAAVKVDNYSTLYTGGSNSHGILAQSIGGGGGNANFNIGFVYASAADPNGENKNLSFTLTVGGGTGDGGSGGTVDVVQEGIIETVGNNSFGILAQSVGGGGGNAGFDFGMALSNGGTGSITIGRRGGTGGWASDVNLSSKGTVITRGTNSYGLLAQSVGNGGGNSSATTVGISGPETKDDAAEGASVSVGLEGGLGGYAGNVTLNAEGFVDTYGDNSHAIFAQSVGGGGGNGGLANTFGVTSTVTLGLSIGGLGGEGGYAGAVDVTSSAQVRTYGAGAVGILAQSIGGGGGTGGIAASGGTKSKVDGITVAVGGNGGKAATAGNVTVNNSAIIITDGLSSHAILAQSLGDGGGNSGMVFNAILSDAQKTDPSYRASISVGGTGGEGGTAGNVEVTNTGRIGTEEDSSVGIFAQSVGGGGGNGGMVLTTSAANDQGGANATISIGGSGGTGGTGGKVTVINKPASTGGLSGTIDTLGTESHGILAMSVGGGGGTGSTTISVLRSAGAAANNTTTTGLIFSLGGSGGTGGAGGEVIVENEGTITTLGGRAHGIAAMSIGGGGGSGGVSVTGDLVFGKKPGNTTPGEIFSIAIGGFGGAGNKASDVTVTNGGRIETLGHGSAGIFAQSVGGGGGSGGFAATLSKNLLTNPFSSLLPALQTIGMGGNGGSGADAGDVVVENTGTIIVRGDKSTGIYAQSMAGGGGQAAFALTAPVWMAADLVANVILGARNGNDGQAGTVTVRNNGNIEVYGVGSRAQFVQAAVGGGGDVSRFLDFSEHAATIDTNGAIILPNNGGDVDTVIGAITSTIKLGTDAVSGLVGSGVDWVQNGDFYMDTEKSIGALIQSIGGGGGNTDDEIVVNTSTRVDLENVLGATNSSNNSAGDLTSARTGDVEAHGFRSGGSKLQTIGGGGGTYTLDVTQVPEPALPTPPPPMGAMAAPPPPPPPGVFVVTRLGADGGIVGASNGGNITTNDTGDVSTTGDYATALVFQSIGAGGGDVGYSNISGLDVSLGGINGATGNGGNISITNTGLIYTEGVLSNAIVIQTIGGGGGNVLTDLVSTAINVTLNTANTGNGGIIDYTQNGNVVATGARSTAIILQSLGGGGGLVDDLFVGSAGGAGNSGAITLVMNGSVIATGTSGVGILAQSQAAGTQGNITVTLRTGEVLVFGNGGTGVKFSGGATNLFTNNGTAVGVDGLSGWVFRGEEGNDTFQNNGTFLGQADFGAGTNAFNNAAGATLVLGPQFLLGTLGSTLTNSGELYVGGTGLAQHTDMTGGFTQTSTGTTYTELDLGTNVIDNASMTGAGSFAGAIQVALLNPQVVTAGAFQKVLFHADGGVTDNGMQLATAPSVVVNYALNYLPNGQDLALDFSVNFNPPGSELSRNLAEVGAHINGIQNAGSSPSLAAVIIRLLYEPTMDGYRALLSQMGPDFYGEQQAEMLRGSQRFGETVLSGGNTRFNSKGRRIWFDVLGASTFHGRFDDYKTVQQSTTGFALGFESIIGRSWTAGLAVALEDNMASGYEGRWSAEGTSQRVGGVVRFRTGHTEVAGLLSYGWNNMDSSRVGQVTTPFETNASRNIQTFTAMMRMSHEFGEESLAVVPRLDVGVTHLAAGAATESGADAISLYLHDQEETHAWVRPAITIRKAIPVFRQAKLRIHAEVGYQYFLTGNDTYVRGGFTGAPGGVDPMNVPIDLGSMATLSMGAQLLMANDLSIGLYYTKAFSEKYKMDLWNLRVNKDF